MQTEDLQVFQDRTFDVVIAGGGLAGLTLARQLRREHPSLSVLVVEKSTRPLPIAAHKVGESSVELGSQYLERLGLRDYLHREHLIKFGLRFFPGGGQLPLEQRCEIGPSAEPVVTSYQIDRGRFENDLREMVEADGATLLEGVRVRDIELNGGEDPHRVTIERNGVRSQVTARWFVDASGRNALLRKKLKLTRGTHHEANSGWFRVDGRIDLTDLAPAEASDWHKQETASERWRSTTHLMGEGYWVWIIPLSSDKTSIGVVVHDEVHGFDSVRTLERAQAFIKEHEPVLAKALAERNVLDFACLHGFSHSIGRCYSADRWAVVGEAGAFVDPLYSPGTDFIAFANSFTEELIRVDQAGEDLRRRATELNVQYRTLVMGAADIFRTAAPVYGHARAMRAKVYWDNFAYWCFPCQYYLQGIYRLSGEQHEQFTRLGQRFVELSGYVQALMRQWALLAPEQAEPGFAPIPAYPSILIDTHLALQEQMTPDQARVYMQGRAAEGEEIVASLLLNLVYELGEQKAREMFETLRIGSWHLRVQPERLAAERSVGLARRHALSPIARDVERTLGRPQKRSTDEQVQALLAPLVAPAGAALSADQAPVPLPSVQEPDGQSPTQQSRDA